MAADHNGGGHANGLTTLLEVACRDQGCKLKDLTVLAAQNDPYRADTPRFREAGEWFAEQVARIDRPRLHCRGYHYALLGETKPDGTPYINDGAHWKWLQE